MQLSNYLIIVISVINSHLYLVLKLNNFEQKSRWLRMTLFVIALVNPSQIMHLIMLKFSVIEPEILDQLYIMNQVFDTSNSVYLMTIKGR